MKKFFLFSGEEYYPFGGWSDFDGAFGTIEEAMEIVTKKIKVPNDGLFGPIWFQIVDSETLEVVCDEIHS